jgi:hypothetical protein
MTTMMMMMMMMMTEMTEMRTMETMRAMTGTAEEGAQRLAKDARCAGQEPRRWLSAWTVRLVRTLTVRLGRSGGDAHNSCVVDTPFALPDGCRSMTGRR